MEKDSFFDTNVIIYYASYYTDSPNFLHQKSFSYINSKSGKFFVCYVVMKELFSIMGKRALIQKEVLKKIEDGNYSLDSSQFLEKRDIPQAKQLYEQYKEKDREEISKKFAEDRKFLEIRIEQFLKKSVDNKVIPIENINQNITNVLREVIENYTDCKILASALQYQQDKEVFFFVTADKHFDPNSYDYLKNYDDLKKYIFPELKNILYD